MFYIFTKIEINKCLRQVFYKLEKWRQTILGFCFITEHSDSTAIPEQILKLSSPPISPPSHLGFTLYKAAPPLSSSIKASPPPPKLYRLWCPPPSKSTTCTAYAFTPTGQSGPPSVESTLHILCNKITVKDVM